MLDHSPDTGCRLICNYGFYPVTGISQIDRRRINTGQVQRCLDSEHAVWLIRPDLGDDALRMGGIGHV